MKAFRVLRAISLFVLAFAALGSVASAQFNFDPTKQTFFAPLKEGEGVAGITVMKDAGFSGLAFFYSKHLSLSTFHPSKLRSGDLSAILAHRSGKFQELFVPGDDARTVVGIANLEIGPLRISISNRTPSYLTVSVDGADGRSLLTFLGVEQIANLKDTGRAYAYLVPTAARTGIETLHVTPAGLTLLDAPYEGAEVGGELADEQNHCLDAGVQILPSSDLQALATGGPPSTETKTLLDAVRQGGTPDSHSQYSVLNVTANYVVAVKVVKDGISYFLIESAPSLGDLSVCSAEKINL